MNDDWILYIEKQYLYCTQQQFIIKFYFIYSNQKLSKSQNILILNMLVKEKVISKQYNEQQKQLNQQTNQKSSKLPTHFTIQTQNQSKNYKFSQKQKTKTKSKNQDKQYKKLNKQQKKSKSLQQQYKQLQYQIKQLQQMVNLQLQIINHTTRSYSQTQNIYIKQEQHRSHSDNIIQKKSQTQSQNQNVLKSEIGKIQKLIEQLFKYQETIQVANSNYLLLSQINKEQEGQSLFHVNSLQDRIRQLRFLLNGKQDLLAYELATINSKINSNMDEEDDPKQFTVDYLMPKKITMGNLNNMDAEYKFVQKAVKQMGKLKSSVEQLELQLSELEKQENLDSQRSQQKAEKNEMEVNLTERFHNESHNIKVRQFYENITNGCVTVRNFDKNSNPTNNTPQITKRSTLTIKNNNKQNNNIQFEPQQINLQFLPLSQTNYKDSLIYKVGKLATSEQQKSVELKQTYKKLVQEYKIEAQKKKQLISEYEIQQDIYQYKKKQLSSNANANPLKLKNILEQLEEEETNPVNLENILDELNEQQKTEVQAQTQIYVIKQKTDQQQQFNSQSQQSQSKYFTVNSSDSNSASNLSKDSQAQNPPFNQITNTPQKQPDQSNPFLKLKLKSSFLKYSSNKNPLKQNSSKPSRFSQQKYSQQNNPTAKKQPHMVDQDLNEKPQQLKDKAQEQNGQKPIYKTPSKRRRPLTLKKSQHSQKQQATPLQVEN